MIHMTQYEISGLPSDTGKRNQFLYGIRYNTVKSLKQFSCTGLYVFGLVMIEARGLDILLKLCYICCCKCLQIHILFEQLLCHHIYSVISTLSTEDGGKQKLPCIAALEKRWWITAIAGIKYLHDLMNSLSPFFLALTLYIHRASLRQSSKVTLRPVASY